MSIREEVTEVEGVDDVVVDLDDEDRHRDRLRVWMTLPFGLRSWKPGTRRRDADGDSASAEPQKSTSISRA